MDIILTVPASYEICGLEQSSSSTLVSAAFLLRDFRFRDLVVPVPPSAISIFYNTCFFLESYLSTELMGSFLPA